jgi:DNA-binding response OmpR family regulator
MGKIIKVLLVEDEADPRIRYTKELEEAGFQVITTSTAGNAKKLAESEVFDVVVTGVRTPDLDGYDGIQILIDLTNMKTKPRVFILTQFDYSDNYWIRDRASGFVKKITGKECLLTEAIHKSLGKG